MPVKAVCDDFTTRIEANPDKFLRIEGIDYLNAGRARVASLIGAETDECVLVNNTSHGITTVLRNFEWHAGDIIIGGRSRITIIWVLSDSCYRFPYKTATTTYGAVSRAIRYFGDIPPHPQVSTFNLQFPTSHAEILENWRKHIHLVTSKGSDLQQTRKIVAIVDAIVANPGVHLPWKEMVAICRDAGVWSVVDAAHSIGQEVDINLSEVKPDFWVSVRSPISVHDILMLTN
jgi:selenocysteine lyase/cysteine desulfurase